MISISEKAARQINRLREDEADPQAFLRVSVKKGGCSGLSYKLTFETEQNATDKVFEEHNSKVVIAPDSYLYIIGMTLDFDGGLNGKGFVFSNPNAAKSCGCGMSFNV